MSISVVLLAYKEAENLKLLLPQIKDVLEDIGEKYEILIIDSAEPLDNTKEVCKENGAKYIPQEKPYYAGAFRTGIKYARGKKMVVLDADGSHNPKNIADINRLFDQGYDMVIGSRYTKGGITNDSAASHMMSTLLNTVMRVCLGVKAKDISTSYRMYDTDQLKKVRLVRNNYDVLQEVILRMKINKRKAHEKLRIGETPIVFEKRVFGESKRQLWRFIKGYMVSVFIFTKANITSIIRDH